MKFCFLVLLSLLYKRLKSTKNKISLLHLLSQAFALWDGLGNVALALALSGLALLTSLLGRKTTNSRASPFKRSSVIVDLKPKILLCCFLMDNGYNIEAYKITGATALRLHFLPYAIFLAVHRGGAYGPSSPMENLIR